MAVYQSVVPVLSLPIHPMTKTILSGPVPCCSTGMLVDEVTAGVCTRPTEVQRVAFERTLLAPKDGDGTQTLPHACSGVENGGRVCSGRWYHS
jgi:hypothetical protein